MMLGTTDWLLKRFLKFVLKRNVGKYLSSELDLEQLDVRLDTGKLELKNLLLNCDILNHDLALQGWVIKAGFIGSVTAMLPFSSLASGQCTVLVNEVKIVVAPSYGGCGVGNASPALSSTSMQAGTCPNPFAQDIPSTASGASAPPAATAPSGGGGLGGFLSAEDFGWTGQGAVMDGIKRIAGSLQSMLQHLRVEATDVLIRVELPHPYDKSRIVTAALKLDLVEFSDLSATSGSAAGGHGAAKQAGDPAGPVPVGPQSSGGAFRAPATQETAMPLGSSADAAAGAKKQEIAKHVQVKGLSLDLFEGAPLMTNAAPSAAPAPPVSVTGATGASAATGLTLISGPGKDGIQLSMEIRMLKATSPSESNRISVDMQLGAVRLQLLPSHATCLAALKAALDQQPGGGAAFADRASCDGYGGADSGAPDLWASCVSHGASVYSVAGHWDQRSLIESIMLPDCEGVVAHSLEPYVAGVGLPYGDTHEFHDACSRLGSFASSFVSSVTQNGSSLVGYVAASSSAAVGGAMGWVAGQQRAAERVQVASAAACVGSPPQRPLAPTAPSGTAAAGQATVPVAAAPKPAQPGRPPPVVSIRSHISHAAVVLSYASPGAGSASAGQQSTRNGVARGPGGAGRAVASTGAQQASAAGGSLILEMHDMCGDVRIDAAHGNIAKVQAGQLQVYEQLPASYASAYGMSATEWGRVPDFLPQAPHRFRPTLPAPARTSLSGSVSPNAKSAGRPAGRNSLSSSGGNSGMQAWTVLTCASAPFSGGSPGHGPGAHVHGHGYSGHSTSAWDQAGSGAFSSSGCLRLRVAWDGPGADHSGGAYSGCAGGVSPPSVDVSVEVLPVTLWLSSPLLQRITDFASPLGAALGGGRPNTQVVVKPQGPLPRVALTVAAPHVCVLLGLLPPSPPQAPLPRAPGTPVFIAVDIVSAPHPVETTAAVPASVAPHHPGHSHPFYAAGHQHPHRHAPGTAPSGPPYSGYGSPPHNLGHGPGHLGHQPVYTPHQPARAAWPAYGGFPQVYPPHAVPAPPPLVCVYQVPATDRLIPSQVTTMDVAVGIVEVMLVRTPATPLSSTEHLGAGATATGSAKQLAAGASGAAPWTAKTLFKLGPAPPTLPLATPASRAAWEASAPQPPTGPEDVPPGCGLHLHICSDPGAGAAAELVSEAWGHVATHAQDRWADSEGEGGAWEERSSFRSVAFHERCRRSSATFVHLRAPRALLHLSRADMTDLAALPQALLAQPAPSAPAARAVPGGRPTAAQRPAYVPPGAAPQTCALMEVCLTVQLQDDPPTEPTYQHAAAAATPAAPSVAGSRPMGPRPAADGRPPTAAVQALGAALGGSRIGLYELTLEELTVFRASNLGSEAGCHVTSVHAHGATLLGYLEAPAGAGAPTDTAASAAQPSHRQQHCRNPSQQPQRQPQPMGQGAPGPTHGSAPALCMLHCPRSGGASDKATACIEYVCVQRERPQLPHQAVAGPGRRGNGSDGVRSGAGWGGAQQPPAAWNGSMQPGLSTATAPESTHHSVLLQGVTVSTDHGYVTMDWAEQLAALLQSIAPQPATGQAATACQATQAPQAPSRTSLAGDAAGGATPSRLSVNIVDLALRHEPMEYPQAAHAMAAGAAAPPSGSGRQPAGGARVDPVALALIVEAVHFETPLPLPQRASVCDAVSAQTQAPGHPSMEHPSQSQQQQAAAPHTVVLHSITLHLAAAGQRGPGWGPADPRAIRAQGLQACGYHRVLQETTVKVVAKQRVNRREHMSAQAQEGGQAPELRPEGSMGAASAGYVASGCHPPAAPASVAADDGVQGGEHATLEVEITNQHLLGMLTVESATLLAHFAMQVGTLMTARQAAAVAASGSLPRRDGAGSVRHAASDPCWDAASETVGCYSEAGGDAAGSLLTALLMDEVEEDVFRRGPSAAAMATAAAAAVPGAAPGRSGWYVDADTAEGSDGARAPCLVLIDDFFPVNHAGEYDEDLTLVPYPPPLPPRGARARWQGGGVAGPELEGTWYGPNEGPDQRPAPPASSASMPAPSLGPYHARYDGEEAEVPGEEDEGEDRALYSGGAFASEDPDIDDLLAPFALDSGPLPRAEPSGLEADAEAPDCPLGAVRAGGAGGSAPSVCSLASAATRASSTPTWRLQEDYVRAPRKSEDGDSRAHGLRSGATAASGGRGGEAAAAEAPDQPPPLVRITFKDISGIWVMHTASRGTNPTPSASGGSSGGPGDASGQQAGRVELVVEGLGLQLESYGPGGHTARHMRLSIHDLEIRDCALDVRQQAAAAGSLGLAAAGASGGASGGGGGAGRVRVLGYRSRAGQPRDSRKPLVALALTAVRPDPAACDPRDEELRLAVALLPLRLKLNQDIMSYLAWYGDSVSRALKPAAAVLAAMQASLSELGGCEPLPPPFFQRASVAGFSVTLDYRPRRVDVSALAEGRLLELLNLVPLGGVELAAVPLRLRGLTGWDGLAAAVAREWLQDIARHQVHKFVTGLAPVNAVLKVGSAVATLLAAPARHLARRDGAAAGRQLALQLRRASAGLAQRVVCEAMAAGRRAARGASRAMNGAMYAQRGDEGEGDEYEDGEGEEPEEEGNGEGGGRRRPTGRHGGGGNGGSGGMRRSHSAGEAVRTGLARAAATLGSASQQVAAGLQTGGLQRGVGNVARVLSTAAASGVSAAAPASAALHGQLKGTFRSVRRAIKKQLKGSGSQQVPHAKAE